MRQRHGHHQGVASRAPTGVVQHPTEGLTASLPLPLPHCDNNINMQYQPTRQCNTTEQELVNEERTSACLHLWLRGVSSMAVAVTVLRTIEACLLALPPMVLTNVLFNQQLHDT